MLDGEGQGQAPLTESGPAIEAMDAADAALERTVDEALGNEAPAESSGAPAQPAAPAESAPAAQPRDPKGRFTQQPPSAEAPPDDPAPAPAPDAQGEPTAEAEAPAGTEPEPAAEAEQYSEATYRYDGKDAAIPGSAVGENGAFIPTAEWNGVQELIALGRSAREGSIRQQLRAHGHEATRWKSAIDAAVASRDEVFNAISAMVEAEQKGDIERGFSKWAENLIGNWEILRAKALLTGKEVELAEERRQRETFEQERERDRREPQMQQALEKTVAHYAQVEQLDADARKALVERLNSGRFRQQIFIQATEDDPVTGVKKGEWLVDYGVIEDEVKYFARAGGGRKQADAQRVQQLQAENARRTGQPSKAPPVAPAKRGQAPAPALKLPDLEGKSAEEVDALIWDKGGYKSLTS